MEYNADNVAVRFDRFRRPDLRPGPAEVRYGMCRPTLHSRSTRPPHHRVSISDDLFFHQGTSAQRLRHLAKDERLAASLPTFRPTRRCKCRVFAPADNGAAERYRCHPADLTCARETRSGFKSATAPTTVPLGCCSAIRRHRRRPSRASSIGRSSFGPSPTSRGRPPRSSGSSTPNMPEHLRSALPRTLRRSFHTWQMEISAINSWSQSHLL